MTYNKTPKESTQAAIEAAREHSRAVEGDDAMTQSYESMLAAEKSSRSSGAPIKQKAKRKK